MNARERVIAGIGLPGTVISPGLLDTELVMDGENDESRDGFRWDVVNTAGS